MDVKQYIIEAARKRGIDPNVAVRAAMSEGGLSDPFQRGRGPAPKSQKFGGTEHSFGPFQMYISGTGAGLGDAALAAGIDPRTNWQGGVDFALDTVAKEGWKQWYGPRNVGIGRWEGVKGAKPIGTTINSAPITVASGAPAPVLPAPTTISDKPIASVAEATLPQTPMQVLEAMTKEGAGGTLSPLAKVAQTMKPAEPQYVNIDPANALASSEAADASRIQAGMSLMSQIMAARKKRAPGLSLMG